jgi:hypothetical protein
MDQVKNDVIGFDEKDVLLPFEVFDADEVSDFFLKQKLRPFAGYDQYTGDNLLNFYNKMAEYSPTSSSCIESKKIIAFANKLTIVKKTNKDFDLGEKEEVNDASKKKFIEFIENLTIERFSGLKDLSISCYEEWEKNGNVGIHIKLFEVGKDRKCVISKRDTAHFRYDFDDNVVLSYQWNHDYITKNPPITIPIYPKATRIKGVIHTFLHFKNSGFFYGRPPSKGSILNQYGEYQNYHYLCKVAQKDFVVRLIMEIEDDAPKNNRLINNKRDREAGYEGTLDRIERKFTNKAKDPSTIMALSRPPNAKPMEVHQIQPNTSDRFYQRMDAVHSGLIIKSHNWSARLLGGDSNSFLSKDVYLDELKVKDATINLYNQNKIHEVIDTALDICKEWMENTEIEEVTFNFNSPYLRLIKNERIANGLTDDQRDIKVESGV